MKKESENLVGQRFGRLTVIEKMPPPKNRRGAYWKCRCDCGNEIVTRQYNLKCGDTKSCGCLHKDICKNLGISSKKHNIYDLTGEFGKGYTLKGEEFWFDKEDYDKIKDYCWAYNKIGYLYTTLYNGPKAKNKKILLHRLIMNFPKNKVVDHINHNKKDNRKINLRICTQRENTINKKYPKINISGEVGVFFWQERNKWVARIGIMGKTKTIGYFKTKEDAVKARKTAEEKYFGEFAYKDNLNSIDVALEDEGIL